MLLFSKEQPKPMVLSQEAFVNYYSTASVVSTEAISDYFFKLKDTLSTATTKVFSLDDDRLVTDVLSSRFEVENKIKRLKFSNLKPYSVTIPENFKGKYVDYIKDLTDSSRALIPDTEKALGTLKMTLSAFMNEFSEDKADNLFGKVVYKESEKQTKIHQDKISKYFPSKSNATKGYIKDVLNNLDEIPKIFAGISELEKLINPSTLKNITKLTNEVSEMVDLVLEQNNKTGFLLNSNYLKKDLITALHTVAKEVELVAYLYSNAMFFYKAVDSLSNTVKTVSES